MSELVKTRRWVRARHIGALVLLVGLFVTPTFAQISLHPDEPLARERGSAQSWPSIGAGAPSGPPSTTPTPTVSTPGFITWERWWHLRLYGVLGRHAPSAAPLGDVTRERIVAVLAEALEGGGDLERSAAAVALARSGASGGFADLVFALERAAPEVQQSIVLALGMTGRERARALLDSLARDSRGGRRALGDRSAPVPLAVRAAAVLGLGHLAPRRDFSTLRDIVVDAEASDDLRLAAAVAMGLRPPTTPGARKIKGATECERFSDALHAVLDDERVDERCRAALLISLARVAPDPQRTGEIARRWLGRSRVRLARAAASALGYIPSSRDTEILWRRVEDPADAVTAAMALMTLARHADAETFVRMVRSDELPRGVRPYAAFALLEASTEDGDRRRQSRAALKRWLAEDDGPGRGAAYVVLGLLGSLPEGRPFEAAVDRGASGRIRGAAALGMGLLGRDVESDLSTGTPFEQHDGVLAMALTRGDGEALVEALTASRDDYVSGGCARALALCGDPDVPEALLGLLETEENERTRAFAVGALGLLLDGRREFGLERLRDLVPLPTSSPALARILAHL